MSLIVATLSFPLGFGQFIAGELSTHEQVHQLFSNFTWSNTVHTVEQAAIVSNWKAGSGDVLINLIVYLLFTVSS